jgi:cardiolipin synthase
MTGSITGALRHLPNGLTLLRLILAVPLGLLILRHEYGWALGVGIVAGISDALDGFFARRLGVFSRVGAALDPVADKILITVAFLCFASAELIPWYAAAVVIGRDLVIVTGALCYYLLIGPFNFSPTLLSKFNMFLQIALCVMVLLAQVAPAIPPAAITGGTALVMFIAVASGLDYVISWTVKAIQQHREQT